MIKQICLGVALSLGLSTGTFAQSSSADIQVQQLGAVDPFMVGINDVLPENVWSSGDASALRALLEQMPSSDRGWQSPLAARLAERALLSSGEPPEGGRNDAGLAALRADRALASGGAELAFQLLERTPQVHSSPSLARVHAEAAFASGQAEAACRTANSLLENRDAAYWLRARAVCDVYNGNIRAAELSAELARSQSPAPGFDYFLDALALDMAIPSDVGPVSGLELALARQVNPEEGILIDNDAPVWLRHLMESDIIPAQVNDDLLGALEIARRPGTQGRLEILEALIAQRFDREIAAEALAIRLEIASNQDQFVGTARRYADELDTLPINARTLEFGPSFVMAAILSDNFQLASRWRARLVNGPETGAFIPQPASTQGPTSLDPVKPVLSDGDWPEPSAAMMVAIDIAGAIAMDDLTSRETGVLISARIEDRGAASLSEAAAFAALGAEVPADVRAQLNRRAVDPDVAQVNAVPALLTAAAGAIGETQLHAATLLERHGTTPESLAAAVAALRVAGLEEEARRLVLEAFIEEVM